MPVGNASDGIGLFAGQIMFATNINMQHIDWSHGPTQDESFEHWGHLSSTILIPSATIGLSDYWNANPEELRQYIKNLVSQKQITRSDVMFQEPSSESTEVEEVEVEEQVSIDTPETYSFITNVSETQMDQLKEYIRYLQCD